MRVKKSEDETEKKRRVTKRERDHVANDQLAIRPPRLVTDRQQRSADGELRDDVGAQQHLDEGDDPGRKHA